jgi:drug/metabolite transporter (DMT)-like permease
MPEREGEHTRRCCFDHITTFANGLQVTIVLALASALVYGTGDFMGGLASRRATALAVTLVSQCAGLLSLLLVLAFLHGDGFDGADAAWGALGGLCGAVALVSFYWALAAGAMSVVAPLTAVVSAVVPVVTGLALGERPSALAVAGIALAIPAIALISREGGDAPPRATRLVLTAALGAGLGFGFFFVTLARTSGDSGVWPLVAARGASITLLALVVVALRHPVALPRDIRPIVLLAGVADTAANALYLAAVHRGLLSLVAVVAAMYPASTVVLARVVLGERVHRWQVGGFALAALAVALVAGAG